MRRIIAVAAVGVALSLSAACADVPQEQPSSSPTPGKVQLADKKTSCDAYKKLQDEFDAKSTELTPLILAAQGGDQAKGAELGMKLIPMLADYETKLTPIDNNAGDPALRPLLDKELGEVKQVNSDIKAAGLDQAKLQAVFTKLFTNPPDTTDKIKAACGISGK